jgi:amino-acid N-acetyltransferase
MTTQSDVAVTIRPATAGDLAAVEQLLTARHLPTAGVAESLHNFLVAEHDDALVGVVGIEHCSEYGLLRSAAVVAEWQGQGLGRRLVERAIADATASGTRALYLLTTTAERYFPSFGFTNATRDEVPAPIRATAEFESACPASATVMFLGLAHAQ